MPGLLADVNAEGHLGYLLRSLETGPLGEIWQLLNFTVLSFADIDLPRTTADSVLWTVCQDRELVLITGNRNQSGTDSLESTIRACNSERSLPIITIGTPQRIIDDPTYTALAAERLLDILFDLDVYRGTGRLFIP